MATTGMASEHHMTSVTKEQMCSTYLALNKFNLNSCVCLVAVVGDGTVLLRKLHRAPHRHGAMCTYALSCLKRDPLKAATGCNGRWSVPAFLTGEAP